LENVADTIRKYVSDFPYSKEDAEKTDERLDTLNRIVLKYGNSEEAALEYLSKAKEELQFIQFSDEKLAQLENQLILAEERLVAAGKKLTDSRKKAAKSFENQVCQALSFMDMNGVRFIVQINEGKYSKTGRDNIEFLISANAGETVKPLYKVASGGELSRIMLAIKGIIADKDNVETLIFDEIDTGISGKTSRKIGVKLSESGRQDQIICVTHSAQIATLADNHYLIEKQENDGRAHTCIRRLNFDERIEEAARILGGINITESQRQAARDMLLKKDEDC
jgi:DNA repair protein RecN (Recombination protein N)